MPSLPSPTHYPSGSLQTIKATNDMFNFFDLLLNKMENIIKSFNHASHASSASDHRVPTHIHSYIHSSIQSFTHSDTTIQLLNQLPSGHGSRFIGSIRVCGGAHSCDLDGPLLWLFFSLFFYRLPGAVTTTTTTTVMRVTRATTVWKKKNKQRKLTWLL